MTPDELREAAAVLLLAADGKQLQHRIGDGCPWSDDNLMYIEPHLYEYRVKPEPIERWVNVFPDGYSTVWAKEEYAKRNSGNTGRTVHMREVEE